MVLTSSVSSLAWCLRPYFQPDVTWTVVDFDSCGSVCVGRGTFSLLGHLLAVLRSSAGTSLDLESPLRPPLGWNISLKLGDTVVS